MHRRLAELTRSLLDPVWAGLRTVLAGRDEPVAAPGTTRWPRLRAAVAAVATLGTAAIGVGTFHLTGLPVPLNVVVALMVTATVALAPRRPLVAWRLLWVSMLVMVIMEAGLPNQPWPWHPLQMIIYPVVLWRAATRVSRIAIGWLWLATFVLIEVQPYLDAVIVLTVMVSGLLVLADQVRRRRDVQRGLAAEERRSQAEEARRTLLEERTRIARELHDVVAHHMSLVAVRAETAPYRLDGLPEPAREEFAGIAHTAREALIEMRRLLGVLRSDSPGVALAPQPRLADLAELVATARTAGVTVDLANGVDAAAVPPGVQLSAYRIVQEALSNASRHAPDAPVWISLGVVDGGVLRVSVTNGRGSTAPSGPGAGAAWTEERSDEGRRRLRGPRGPRERSERQYCGPGHGIRGMAERAAIVGGSLSARPGDDGGFQVVARLPLAEETAWQSGS